MEKRLPDAPRERQLRELIRDQIGLMVNDVITHTTQNCQGLKSIQEVRDAGKADASVEALVKAENSDRMEIYRGVAKNNGTSVEEVQALYAKRLQADAPVGTPVETVDESTGASRWEVK